MKKRERSIRNVETGYKVVDKLVKGDYIFIHYNGYVFKANNYPYNLRDGIVKRDMLTGESIQYIVGEETADISKLPILPKIDNFIQRGFKKYYEQREESKSAW